MTASKRDPRIQPSTLLSAIDNLYGFAYWSDLDEGFDFWHEVVKKLEAYQERLPSPTEIAKSNRDLAGTGDHDGS